MTARVQLTSVRRVPSGIQSLTRTYTIGDVAYEIPMALQQIDHELVIAPETVPSDDGQALVTRLDRWEVLNLDLNLRIPLWLPDMATAARVAREFTADPGVSWDSNPAEIEAWALAWLKR